MSVQVREKNLEEIEEKLDGMNTALNKIIYLESALKATSFDFEVKRILWEKLSELYLERKMYERSAKAMANKASMEVTFKDKIDSYVTAAELYARAGKVEDSEEMFVRASRDGNNEQKMRVKLARKNVYSIFANELERKGKRVGAMKFYEKLIKMNLDEVEKLEIKHKLLDIYTSLGMFREAKILEGI